MLPDQTESRAEERNDIGLLPSGSTLKVVVWRLVERCSVARGHCHGQPIATTAPGGSYLLRTVMTYTKSRSYGYALHVLRRARRACRDVRAQQGDHIQGDQQGMWRRPMNVGVVSAGMVVVALGLMLAGCGGGHVVSGAVQTQTTVSSRAISNQRVVLNKASYERTMRRLGKTLVGSVEGMFPLVEGGVGSLASAQSLAKVETTRSVVLSVRLTLDAIVPPVAIRADQERLLAGLDNLRSQLDKLIQVLQQGSSKPLGVYSRLSALGPIGIVIKDMKKKGYAIG